MRTCEIKSIMVTFIFLFSVTLTAIGQENRQPSQEELQEFRDQYLSAFQEGNTQKTEQLVRENREHASIMAEFLLNHGKKAYGTADYKTALAMFVISHELYQQLGHRVGEGATLSSIGAVYHATGKHQQALGYYQEALTIFKGIGHRAGEGTTLNTDFREQEKCQNNTPTI